MNTPVCHKGTTRTLARLAALALATVVGVFAQTTGWRPIGTSSADLQLASPVTGPVIQVWYSDDGSLLYARTASGKLFQTPGYVQSRSGPHSRPFRHLRCLAVRFRRDVGPGQPVVPLAR